MEQKLDNIINTAVKTANKLRHEYLTLESVLLALLEDSEVLEVLQHCGIDPLKLRAELETFLKDSGQFSVLTEEQIKELNRQQFADEQIRKLARESGIMYRPEIGLALQRVIQRAAVHVQSSGKPHIKGINLLAALFQERESYAVFLLEKSGATRLQVLQVIAHGVDRPLTEELRSIGNGDDESGAPVPGGAPKKSALEEFCTNLNAQAKKGKLDPIIGREKEIERVVQILSRRRKNNPLLVGEAGVGKTAIAEGLAWSIEQGTLPEAFKGNVVYSLDLAGLLAGTKFRGDFEQRLKAVLKELEKKTDKGEPTILFIDELHTIMGAGAAGAGGLDASNLLKPYLSSGRLRCIGSTTYEEYRRFIEKDAAFGRRFQKVDVDPPSLEDTFKILQGLRPHFEKHHDVKYTNSILRQAIQLSDKYIQDRHFPDKAIDVIDEAGALVKLLPASKKRQNVTSKDLEAVVSSFAKVPKQSVASNEKEKLKNLKDVLKALIFGQDHAVDKVCDAMTLARSGLREGKKPLASFLFAGPTGVGKTELARQLALHMGVPLLRYDMSEYMEKHSVAKLIGAPPGYVGHESGGHLTDAVKKAPHCVLLLDEIEKAHPDIFNILLQVMDHGKLTDSQGRTTDFRNIVLVMTTNAGAADMEEGAIGLSGKGAGGQGAENVSKRDKAIKRFFSPEFRNRLDDIVQFNKLTQAHVLSIVDKFLFQLQLRLTEKKVDLTVTDKLKSWLAKRGFDPKMGARPLERLVDGFITKGLSHEILFGKLEKGGKAIADLGPDEGAENPIVFEFRAAE